jgi:hypothetical protein
MAKPVPDWVLSPHAFNEMRRRGIDREIVEDVLAAPERRSSVRPGREVLESRVTMEAKRYLVRAFVDVDRTPAEPGTVYRTSKIAKYWRVEP